MCKLFLNYEYLSTIYESRAAYNMGGYCELNLLINEHFEQAKGVLDCSKAKQLF